MPGKSRATGATPGEQPGVQIVTLSDILQQLP